MKVQSSSLQVGIYQFILKQPCIIYRTTAVWILCIDNSRPVWDTRY